ncbi:MULTISPECIES: DUF2474 domain-containing protein [unclassified Massilia]|nr:MULTISPECIES: DUF2474 domain-containing protein [unclassified Massilia]MBQ5939428.1 DUF2474 domain-containing protein [Massilia sp. AB1]MBQ5962113.1 DUF2474 domain-containing protein [Massilia sp. ZL223]
MEASKPSGREWARRLAWMAALWLGGVATLALVAFVLRMIMRAAGMR